MSKEPKIVWHVTAPGTYDSLLNNKEFWLFNAYRTDDIREILIAPMAIRKILFKIIVSKKLSAIYPFITDVFSDDMVKLLKEEQRQNFSSEYEHHIQQIEHDFLMSLLRDISYPFLYIMSFGDGDYKIAKKRYRPKNEKDTNVIFFSTSKLCSLARKYNRKGTEMLRFGKVLYVGYDDYYDKSKQSSLTPDEQSIAEYIESIIGQVNRMKDKHYFHDIPRFVIQSTLDFFCGFIKYNVGKRVCHKSKTTLKSQFTCKEHNNKEKYRYDYDGECWHTDKEYRLVYKDYSLEDTVSITNSKLNLNDINQFRYVVDAKYNLRNKKSITIDDKVKIRINPNVIAKREIYSRSKFTTEP